MGPPKRSSKAVKVAVARNTRSRTRTHKTRLITDPAQSTLQLTNQLRALGLYAAPTLGDGNCLFRALADQLWGSPNGHLKLRTEVCEWMEARKERYEGFVDEDRSFDTHIRCMRIPGTYGGHLELSAFAHLKRRNVKVIQPGLVYVIEWDCGWGADPSPSITESPVEEEPVDDAGLNERDKRRIRRNRKKQEKEKVVKKHFEETSEDECSAVYVAYHDWEHFSSVRNLAGPHTGLPHVIERPERPGYVHNDPPASPSASKDKAKSVTPRGKGKGKASVVPILSAPTLSHTSITITPLTPLTPAQIPLPLSRSVSPSDASSFLSLPPSQSTSSTSTSTTPSSLVPLTPPDTSSLTHIGRSPKRTFDESQDVTPASAKRRKRPNDEMDVDLDLDVDENTPSLSDESSHSSPVSSSALSSPSPPTPPAEPEPESPQKPLTQRQRKALGLPRTPINAGKARSAGKIIIPGGRRVLRSAVKAESADVSGEWQTNGTGRLDVRGFRELKI
ncbi:cysteine proteinase [Ramaria rubella]|nr:cysteine proteinase [Ramaria rubella]